LLVTLRLHHLLTSCCHHYYYYYYSHPRGVPLIA
jgi:hypothetical protein